MKMRQYKGVEGRRETAGGERDGGGRKWRRKVVVERGWGGGRLKDVSAKSIITPKRIFKNVL